MTPEELNSKLNSFNQNDDVKKMFTSIVNAYSFLAQSTQIKHDNCSKVAQELDKTSVIIRNSSEHLNDEILQLSNRHLDYVEKNVNDKQEMKIKADYRLSRFPGFAKFPGPGPKLKLEYLMCQ